MQDYLTWGAVITAIGSAVAAAKFWMDMGATRTKTEVANEIARLALQKAESVSKEMSDYKTVVAQQYATIPALAEAERRTAEAIGGLRADLRTMTDQLSRILVEFIAAKRDRETN